MRLWPLHALLAPVLLAVTAPVLHAQQKPAAHQPGESSDAAAIETFEKKIRPVLAQHCYSCHSHDAGKSLRGLSLDSRAGLLKGGSRGTGLVPGHPDKSLVIDAISYSKPDLQMPPKGKLPESVIADLTEWVRHGAVWPSETAVPIVRSASAIAADKAKRSHWAWQPVRKVAPPAVKRAAWPQNAIDRFILAKIEAKGLAPEPKADKRTLIRRAYFDLIGLPPTPEQVDAFLKDTSRDAWRKVIDGLLASPHYGERWGRYWLDVARYGEDQAHSFEPRLYPQGFRFRDWIANSLNSDMPYDQFVKEQIAADLLNEPDKMQQLPALGFFATGPVYYGDSKMLDQYDDRIDTLSRGFLGLTVACARCHDHKFDPITQKDYYSLAGIFASTNYVEVAVSDGAGNGAAGGNRQELIKAKQAEVDKFTAEHVTRLRGEFAGQIGKYVVAVWKLQNRRKMDAKTSVDSVATAEGVDPIMLDRWRKYLTGPEAKSRPLLSGWRTMIDQQDAHADFSAAPQPLADARKVGSDLQETAQSLMKRAGIARRTGAKTVKPAEAAAKDPDAPLDPAETAELDELIGDKGVLTVSIEQLDRFLTGDPKAHYAIIKPELERLKMGAFVHALSDGPKPANVHVLLRGNPATPGDEAPRRFLSVISGDNAPDYTQGSGRLELANSIADKSNPLTARVMVNRIWQHHFGRGIVRTASNFGMLGEPPTHPELLDYLAADFVEHGWSIKALHREIMLSATYQTSSAATGKGDDIDPDDRLLWHMPRRRLDVEAWRDAMLAVSGKLDLAVGGPSQSLSSPDNNRRTFYAAVSRHDLDSMLRLFDFPDPNATTDARMTTTVPLQQLFVLNSDFMVRQAKALAARITTGGSESDSARIDHAFALLFNRAPTDREQALGLAFLQAGSTPSGAAPSGNVSTVSTTSTLATPPGAKAAPQPGSKLTRWEEYAQILLASNEFMYVD